MASSLARTKKSFKRVESKKSHSWWWDSHVAPKHNKWLAENLEEMDQSVKRMLKLIEEDGDSFAKKAQMYYQKRPELISHVEEFYRMYRSLAERYDILSGEVKKSGPSDIQSQESGISDVGSEPPSSLPSPDQRLDHRRSGGPRPAGFDVFLGKGNSADISSKEADETSSTLDSESESDDDSSVNNSNGSSDDQGLHRKIIELEAELRSVKEKLREQEEGKLNGFIKETEDGSFGCEHIGIGEYEEELKLAKEKIQFSEEEINKLKSELEKYSSLEVLDNGTEEVVSGFEHKVSVLEEELKITKERLFDSEKEVANLRNELENKLGSSQAEITKLVKERAFLEDNVKEMDLKCQCLEENIRRANVEKAEMESLFGAKINEKDARVKELELQKDELNGKVSLLRTEMESKDKKIDQMSTHLHQLHIEHIELISGMEKAKKTVNELGLKCKELENEVEKQREAIVEGGEKKREAIRQLCFSIEHYRNGYHMLRQAFAVRNIIQ